VKRSYKSIVFFVTITLMIGIGRIAYVYETRNASSPVDITPAQKVLALPTSTVELPDQAQSSPPSIVKPTGLTANAALMPPPSISPQSVERFKHKKTCFDSMLARDVISHLMDACKNSAQGANDRLAAQCNNLSAKISSGALTAEVTPDKDCPASSTKVTAAYYDAMHQAALSSDVDAQYCFIDRDRQTFSDSVQGLSENDLSDLQDQSKQWAQQAFQRGHWRMVQYIVDNLSAHQNSSYLLAAVPDLIYSTRNINFAKYSLLKLLSYGASGSFAQSLEAQMASLTTNNGVLNQEDISRSMLLGEGDERDAATWAQSTYNMYFKSSAVQTSAPDFCPYPELNAALSN
jgi:hypothetical protein